MSNRSIDKESMYKKIMPSTASIKSGEKDKDVSSRETEQQKTVEPGTSASFSYFQPKILVNIAEYAVKNRLDEALSRFNCCKCDRCVKDIIAISLNTLSVKYVVVYEKDIDQEIKKYDGKVIDALVSAIIRVKNHPRH
jgi:competence protein ComFB